MITSSKKVALIHYAYPPSTGGVEEVIHQQATFLAEHNIEVTVLTGEGKESNPNIRVVEIPELHSLVNINPALQEKILKKGIIDDEFYLLAKTIEEKISPYLDEVGYIIVHNMMTVSWSLPFTFAFSKYVENHPEKKVIIWVHDHMLASTKGVEGTYHPQSSLETMLLTTPLKNVTYVLVSHTFKKYFCEVMHVSDENVMVIPNGISIPTFLNIHETIWKFIKEKDLLSSFPIIFSPVNLVERKNIDYSLEVLSHLKSRYPHAKYIISGHASAHRDTHPYVNFLKNKISELDIEDNTFFVSDILGRLLTSEEIYSLYRVVDVVFYLSRSENFGLPLIESALSKTLIVTSNLDVFHEIAGENLTSIDWESVSPSEAATYIADIINANTTMKFNYKTRNKYDLETILEKYLLPLID